MRRFFSTIMLYAVILIGFSWVYHNNDNARAAVNRIAYVAQANFQQLKSRVTGQKATTTASAKTQQTSSRKNADIVMTTISKDNDAAGMTQMSVDSLTGYFVHGTVYLNTAYLLDPSYGYTMERIVNTAEHELGHAIGLQHTNDISVMQPAGSLYTIQQRDIDAVNELYSSQANTSSSASSSIKTSTQNVAAN